MSITDILYKVVLFLYPTGWVADVSYIVGKESKDKGLLTSKFFHRLPFIMISCWVITWIVMFILFAILPKFYWTVALLSPPLFLISAVSLWQLATKIGKVSIPKEQKKVNILLQLYKIRA